jgi:hypothetical protein
MKSHILKKAVVLDTPQVKAASVDKAGTPVSRREIIRAKASDEGGSLTPSSHFHVQVVEVKHGSRVSPPHGSVPAGYGDRHSPGAAALAGLWVQVPP